MFKGPLLIFLVLHIRNSSGVINAMYNAGKEVWKLYLMLDDISLSDSSDAGGADYLFRYGDVKNQRIKSQIDEIHKQLEQLEASMGPKIVTDSFQLLPSEITIRSCLQGIELSVKSIDDSYEKFYSYINGSTGHSDFTLGELVQNILLIVEGDMTWIRKLVLEENKELPDHKNLVTTLSDHADRRYNELCGGPQLISSILIQLFRMVMTAEMKANLMLPLANIYRYSQYNGWKMMNSFAKEAFERHFASYVNIFSPSISNADSLYMRACDPVSGSWTRNKNFYELERTFQTTIFRYHWGVCKYGSCNDVWFVKPNRCEPETYDERTSCSSGTMSECFYLSAIRACVLKTGPYKFQYVNSTKMGPLGRNFKCPRNDGYVIEDGKNWNLPYAACACNCYGTHNKISLSIMESKVTSNKVITGLRFFRKDNILYIQPREGLLGANGYVRRNTQSWVRIPNVDDTSEIHRIDSDNRVFFLDDVHLPPFYVLTGVKFNRVTRGKIIGFAIEIFGLPFHYESGILYSENKYRASRQAAYDNPGTGLSFEGVRSFHASIPHTPNPPSIKYVALKQSKLDVDFGQSTLPFFDIVPITPNPPSVLGGIGIFHKGTPNFAGFISLRVFGIKYGRYFLDFQQTDVVDKRVVFNHSNYD